MTPQELRQKASDLPLYHPARRALIGAAETIERQTRTILGLVTELVNTRQAARAGRFDEYDNEQERKAEA